MSLNVSKYEIITEYIRKKIATGALIDGNKVPSENALTKKFGVSRDTVRRAFKELEEEGILVSMRGSGTYVRTRKKSTSNRIAVITTYVENYIFPKIIMGIEGKLSENGYVMQLSFTNNLFEKERDILEEIADKEEVAGVIMEPVRSALPNPNLDCYERLKEKGIPVLFINTYYRESGIPHISLNDEAMGYMATKYLTDRGHRKIGAILKMDDGQGHLRFSGFGRAMFEVGVKNSSENVVWYDTSDEANIEGICRHLDDRLKDCTAVFCYNDKIALDYILYLSRKGIKVPEDISIISMDNSMLADCGDIKITSCPHPMEELGQVAGENLLQLIENPRFNATKEFVTTVIERGSVNIIG